MKQKHKEAWRVEAFCLGTFPVISINFNPFRNEYYVHRFIDTFVQKKVKDSVKTVMVGKYDSEVIEASSLTEARRLFDRWVSEMRETEAANIQAQLSEFEAETAEANTV